MAVNSVKLCWKVIYSATDKTCFCFLDVYYHIINMNLNKPNC